MVERALDALIGFDTGWVCEEHPGQPWRGASKRPTRPIAAVSACPALSATHAAELMSRPIYPFPSCG